MLDCTNDLYHPIKIESVITSDTKSEALKAYTFYYYKQFFSLFLH